MALIKSYGNYVIQEKHKLTNNGTIFERDYSTIGGVGDGVKSNNLTYYQGNFVYEINNEIISTKLYNKNEWFKNDNSEYWTQDSLSNLTSSIDSLNIILKQDLYKLKDFAYYGSCAELVRSSIIDIINNFPGELYVLNSVLTNDEDEEILSPTNKKLFVLDNPFNLDLHTPSSNLSVEEQEKLKYILPNIDKYEIITSNNVKYSINEIKIDYINGNCINDFFCEISLNIKLGMLNLITTIFGYYDKNGNVIYLVDEKQIAFRIRPKQKYYNEFINNLDSFQKILLNVNSKPIYSAIFEVMEENEYGYKTFYKKFIFPLSEGNYNLDILSNEYHKYVDSLSKYALLYDNLYCNNLYRHMTHESIKNFDWSDVLQRNNETKQDYDENGEKIQKLLFLCGREFDEIKFYIDGIKNSNIITYNDANNIPDYFLTDTLNIEGWDVKNVFPYIYVNDKWIENLNLEVKTYGNVVYSSSCGSIINFPNGYFSGYWGIGCTQTRNSDEKITNNIYATDNKKFLREKIKQYITDKNYSMQELNNKFMKYLKINSRSIFNRKGTIESIESLLSLFGMRSKRWFDSLESNVQHRLKNDMNINYDFEIKEYVAITNPLVEKNTIKENIQNLPKNPYLYDYLNSTKKIVYNTKESKNGIYVPYQGLPIRYYELENGERVLYPYFSYNKPIDGNPYYQMNGGWLHKEYTLSTSTLENNDYGFVDTNTQIPVVENVKELLKIQEESLYDGIIYYVKNIKGYYICVNEEIYDIKEDMVSRYFEVPIYNGAINIGNQKWYGSIETYSNEIKSVYSNTSGSTSGLTSGNTSGNISGFISGLTSGNTSGNISGFISGLTSGNTSGNISGFISGLTSGNTSGSTSGDDFFINEETKEIITIDLTKYENGSLLKIFIKNDNTIFVKQDERILINYAIFRNGSIETIGEEINENNNKTQYFILEEKQWKNTLGFWGWNQLSKNDSRYITIKSIKRDYNGNNPHTNGFKYDNGVEYVKYFKQLFKYAIENEYFDVNCFSTIKEYMSSLYYIENEIGFDNLIVQDDCKNQIKLYEDDKIHHFCDYYTPNEIICDGTLITSKTKYFYELNSNENVSNTEEKDYYNFYETSKYNKLKNDNNLKTTFSNKKTCLDQIINLKNITIIFKNINKNNDEQIKYFDEIILHYLSQILPSNVILNIKFEN